MGDESFSDSLSGWGVGRGEAAVHTLPAHEIWDRLLLIVVSSMIVYLLNGYVMFVLFVLVSGRFDYESGDTPFAFCGPCNYPACA